MLCHSSMLLCEITQPVHRVLLPQAAKKQAEARGDKVAMLETDWRWWGASFTEQNPYKVRLSSLCCGEEERLSGERLLIPPRCPLPDPPAMPACTRRA